MGVSCSDNITAHSEIATLATLLFAPHHTTSEDARVLVSTKAQSEDLSSSCDVS